MELRGITFAFVCAGILGGAGFLGAAEKIQFSTPSQAPSVASPERTIPKSSPSLFDNFHKGGADALNMPMPQPQNRAAQPDKGDKKDWLFGNSQDQSPGSEDMFKRKGSDQKQPAATGLARYVEGVEKQEAASQLVKRQEREDKLRDQDTASYSRRNQDSIQSAIANPTLNQASDRFGSDNVSFSDYWKEATGMNQDRFAEQTDLRRAEFQQIFETRSTGQGSSEVNDAIRSQLANPRVQAPTDFSSRTSQSTVSEAYQGGYVPLTGARATAFDDVNSRALGRDSSSLNTRIEQPRVQSKPAMLQFPTRPGELFKRPGSY